MKSSLPDGSIEYGSRPGVDNRNENYSTPHRSVFHSHGQDQSASGSTQNLSNYSTTNLYAPNCPTMMTAPTTLLPPPAVLPIPPHPRFRKSLRYPLCPHAPSEPEKPRRSVVVKTNIECTNCGTRYTSAWRRGVDGKPECNACNLFFRKNGRRRPLELRCDTVVRRYRRPRCKLCAKEAKGKPGQFRKSSLLPSISQCYTVQSSDFNSSQSNAAENFLTPSNASEVNDQLSYAGHSHSACSGTGVFVQHVLAEAPDPSPNVMSYESVNKELDFTDHRMEVQQKQTCQSFIEYPNYREPVPRNMFSNNQFEDRYSEAFAIINEGCLRCSHPNCSSVPHGTPFEGERAGADASGNTLSETSALFHDDSNEENGERAPVYLSL